MLDRRTALKGALATVALPSTSLFAKLGDERRTLRLYDSHAHLVSSDQQRYPHHPYREARPTPRPGVRSPFGPGTVGIPGGMHGPHPVNEKPTAEQMHKWMAEENVEGIAAVQKGTIYGTDNSYILDAAGLFPSQMKAIIIVDPMESKTLPMIRASIKRGIVGVRFFPVDVEDKAAWLRSPQALEVFKLADELGIAVDLEAPSYDADAMIPVVESMADCFPKLNIVLDHLFMPIATNANYGIDKHFSGFAARPKVYLKWTSLVMDVVREQGVPVEKVLRRAVDFYGPDKIMWGSDIGTSSGTYKEMVQRAIDSTSLLSNVERKKVLHDTGRRVFGS